MGKSIAPHLATTGVGSLPHRSAEQAVADVLAFCPEYPYWPQLPRRDSREDMYRQYSAGLPGLGPRDSVAAAAGGDGGLGWRRDDEALRRLEQVYTDVLAGESSLDRWAIGRADAAGLYALDDALRGRAPATSGSAAGPGHGTVTGAARFAGLKGQITGPVSLGLAVTEASGRALLYEEDLMDGVARGLALRARWQERFLEGAAASLAATGRQALAGGGAAASASGAADGPATLISVDEPYLGTFGSAYFPYRPETVLGYLKAFDEALSGVWGLHCCANTDWEFVLGSPAGFVSFDAYAYGDRLVLYPEAVKAFVGDGKTIVWGIVPTAADRLAAEDAASLTRRLDGLFETLVARGVPEETLARQSMITPACGLAGLTLDDAKRAMSLALEVSREMRAAIPPRE